MAAKKKRTVTVNTPGVHIGENWYPYWHRKAKKFCKKVAGKMKCWQPKKKR